jgi:two-component system response regulator YesN
MSDQKIKLLVVDDDEDIVLMMSDFLEMVENSHLFSVTTSKSFDDAASIISNLRPDVLITDITLPGGGGLLLAGSLRDINAGAFVVIMSGWNYTINNGKDVPRIDAYLKKPFEFDKFDELITQIASSLNRLSTLSK